MKDKDKDINTTIEQIMKLTPAHRNRIRHILCMLVTIHRFHLDSYDYDDLVRILQAIGQCPEPEEHQGMICGKL